MTVQPALPRLNPAMLATLGAAAPAYDREAVGEGIVHLGVGAFHRAHQGLYTDDAVARFGGDWGIVGVALKQPETPEALNAQQGLYTVETLGQPSRYRVVGALKRALHAPSAGQAVLSALAAPNIHVVTLTVTEKGYTLGPDGALDFQHPEVAQDLIASDLPRTAVGWLAAGLVRRAQHGAGPITVISCDNLGGNGRKLGRAVSAFVAAKSPDYHAWVEDNVAFPDTMVDCIVPATTTATVERVSRALGFHDPCCVNREPFSQWVIEDRFAGPRPAWDAVGVQLSSDVQSFERLKLHVLNAAHSAIAYLGLARGFNFVHEAVGDPDIAAFLEELVEREVAPALSPLGVASYWRIVRGRFSNPAMRHSLIQIAADGSAKLSQRVLPLLVSNARAGLPSRRLAEVVRAWLAFVAANEVADPKKDSLQQWRLRGAAVEAALDDPDLFPDTFRTDASVRKALEMPS